VEKLVLKIRIPEYAQDTKISLNKEVIEPEQDKGYFIVKFEQSGKNQLVIDFGVKARWVTAKDEVRDDSGKAALVKGPLVYCLEEIENGKNLSSIYIDMNKEINQLEVAEGLVGDVPVLTYEGIRLKNSGIPEEELYGEPKFEQTAVKLQAVPYCLWNNRGVGEMQVWQKIKL
jgi:DUF1680 family protein